MKRNFLLLLLALLLGLAVSVGWAQERAATYYGVEGKYDSDHGYISRIDEANQFYENVLKIPAKGDNTLGLTTQYVMFYNGKIYAVSKQKFGGQPNRLVRIDPVTWKIERMDEELSFDFYMDDEVRTFHLLGIDDKTGYLSGSESRIYKIDLDKVTVEEVIEGAGWDDLTEREVGSMVLYRGRIIVEVFGKYTGNCTDVLGHELWVLKVDDGSLIAKFSAKGLFNPVVTLDGRLLAVRVQDGTPNKRYSLVELDVNKPSSDPKVLLEFDNAIRPADFQTQRWSWSQGHLFASTRENRLFWNVGPLMFQIEKVASMDLNQKPLEPKVIIEPSNKLYGITRENPHDGSLWTNKNGDYNMRDLLQRYVRQGGVYHLEHEYEYKGIAYGFASCPFFEDKYAAEVAKPGTPIVAGVGDEIDLCDYVIDRDGFGASVLFSDLVVTSGEWQCQLTDHHVLKVLATPNRTAQVQLRAFSSGKYSDVIFNIKSSLRLMPINVTGSGSVVVKNGKGDPVAADAELKMGELLTIEASAGTGYEIAADGLEVTGAEMQSDGKWKVKDDVTIRATFTPKEYTFVAISHEGEGTLVVKNADGKELKQGDKVAYGTMLSVEATPATGYELATGAVKVEGADKQPDGKWKVTGDVSVKAIFSLKQFTITEIASEGEGSLVVKNAGGNELHKGDKVVYGTMLTLEVMPVSGWKLAINGLSLKGVEKQSGEKYKVIGNVEVKAVFVEDGGGTPPATTYTLTAISVVGSGEVKVSNQLASAIVEGAKIVEGELLTIAINPATGWEVKPENLVVNGAEQQAEGRWKVTGDVSVKVTFTPKEYTLVAISHEGEGTVVVKDADGKELKQGDNVAYGTMLSVEATAATGYELVPEGVKVEGAEQQADSTWKVTGGVTVKATFSLRQFTIAEIAQEGTGSLVVKNADGKELKQGDKVAFGTALTIDAKPATDYELLADGLKVEGAKQQADGTWKVTGDVTVKVIFSKKPSVTPPATGPFKLKSIKVVRGEGKVEVNRSSGEFVNIDDQVNLGELLIITQIAAEGYEVCTGCLNVKGAKKEGGSWRVEGDVEIMVKFEKKEVQPNNIFNILSIEQIGKGEIVVTNQHGERLERLAMITKDDRLSIVGKPAEDYELPPNWLTVTGATEQTDGTWLVAGDVTIKVIFRKQGSELSTAVESVLLADAAVSPNPFTRYVYVRASSPVARCVLYDALGGVVYSKVCEGSHLTLDFGMLPNGFYLLQLYDNEGCVKTFALVKQ